MDKSIKPIPTTVRPITAPLEKAIRNPLFKLCVQAWVVRAEDFVATTIPI